jgi:hypothetical protein
MKGLYVYFTCIIWICAEVPGIHNGFDDS